MADALRRTVVPLLFASGLDTKTDPRQTPLASLQVLENAVFTRPGALIQHDGHASERWSSASCGSFDRALVVAKKAIDGDVIR